jgi:hypothetical protein
LQTFLVLIQNSHSEAVTHSFTLNLQIMAELNYSPGKSGGRHSLKKMPVRVDLTAMVDLAS